MLYFPQIKNTTPQIGDFGATETALTSASLFVHSLLETSLREQTSKHEETGWGSSKCVELFKQWATFPPPTPLLSYLFLFFLLGNRLKPVLKLAMVYSGGKLKKLDKIRLGSLELPLMCLFIRER